MLLLLISGSGLAQNKSNRGKEFWLAYGYNSNFFASTQGLSDPVNAQELAIYISTQQAATVTVSINGTSWSQTLNIPANTVDASIIIPKSGADDARILNDGLSQRGIHIVSDVPVAAYAHMYNLMYSAATMLMPVETYGYLYYSINYTQTRGLSSLPPVSASSYNIDKWYSWFFVVASEDNTRVQITPSDTTRNGWLPGQTYTVNLNRGETYTVFGKAEYSASIQGPAYKASKDMTGSKVLSVSGADGQCHPIGLFSGSGGIHICKNDGGEGMQQQIFPTQAWGTRYLTYHTLTNTTGDLNEDNRNYYRIAVLDPATVVKRNGVPMTGLINNFYYECVDSTGGDYYEADKPIMVSQYTPNYNNCWRTPPSIGGSYGDPEMIYLSPIEQGQKSVLFYTSRKNAIDYVYTNIHVPTSALGSLRVDGNPVAAAQTRTHPNNPAYTVAVVRLTGPAAQHTITCDSAITAIVYGLGYYESYGYNVGCNINNLNNYSEIKNTLNTNGQVDTFTCPRTPFRLYAKLAYAANSITWKLSQVPGLNPNTDSVSINPVPVRTEQINNRTYYVYTLQQDFTLPAPGTYTIPITYTAPVIENCSQTEFAAVTIEVKPGPKPDFTISPQQCLTDTVRFTGTTNPGIFNITGYLWTFDDATTQTTINAKKRFATTGAHPVRYQVLADNGCYGDTTKTVTIINGTPTPVSITVSGKPCKDSTLTFTSSQLPNPGNPTTWWWDFGDGNTTSSGSTNITTHAYAASATGIPVKHLATLTTGCVPDTVYYTVPVIHNNPTASFTITADTLCINKPIRLGSAMSNVSNWYWDFGNGTGTTAPPLTRSYAAPGNYTISLRITDANGCGSLPVTNPVIIHPPPAINAGPDKMIKFGQSATLSASIANPSNYSFVWTPGSFLDNPVVLNPVSTPDRMMTYTITAMDKTTFCTGSDQVVVNPVTDLYIPTAFTPNNDGRNDRWNIPGLALYPNAVVSVYNRWGEKIFESKNYTGNPWTGYYKGMLQPAGAYVYTIQVNDDQQRFFKGTVTLIW